MRPLLLYIAILLLNTVQGQTNSDKTYKQCIDTLSEKVTKQTAESIVPLLSSFSKAFNWDDNTLNSELQVSALCEMLQKWKIPCARVYIVSANLLNNGATGKLKNGWKMHVATVIRTVDGLMVIDPTVNQCCIMELQAWKKAVTETGTNPYYIMRADCHKNTLPLSPESMAIINSQKETLPDTKKLEKLQVPTPWFAVLESLQRKRANDLANKPPKIVYNGTNDSLKKAVLIANNILSNNKFYSEIKNVYRFDNTEFTGADIADEIRTFDSTIILKEKTKNTSINAWTQNDMTINTNNLNRSTISIVETLIHETVVYTDWHLHKAFFYTKNDELQSESSPLTVSSVIKKLVEKYYIVL